MHAIVLLVLAAADPTYAVRFDVVSSGLKYTGPCSAQVYAEGSKDVFAALQDTAQSVAVPQGSYEALVRCPSTEGAFARTVPFTVGRGDETVPVKMAPGFLLVHVKRDGVVVKARVTVKDARDREVASGFDRAVLPVPPGKLSIDVLVDAQASGADRDVKGHGEAVIVEEKKDVVEIDTTDGEILVALTDNGREADGVAGLRLPGRVDRFMEVAAGKPAPVPPGTYDVVTTLSQSHDFHEEVKRAVVVKGKQRTSIKVPHKTGAVRLKVLLDGKRIDENVDVELFLGAAPAAFATIAAKDTAKLAPGKFRFVAKRSDATLDDGSPWTAEGKASVSPGSSSEVTLDLSPARIAFSTTVGGKKRAVPVQVFVPGGASPVVERTTDQGGSAVVAVAPGRYRAVAVMKTAHGDLTKERMITLSRGRTEKVALSLDVGVVVVQAFEEGVAVPAEVSFTKGDAAAPLVVVAAGEEALLPPGVYALTVKRKGKERRFGDVRVASGRTLERQVELAAAPSTTTTK